MSVGFRDLIRENSPPWLRRKWGERFLYVPGLVLDAFTHWAIDGVRARFPDNGDRVDHLGALCRDRRIVRGFAEPAEALRVRLKRWRIDHRTRGNAVSMLNQLAAYLTGYAVPMRYVNDRGTWITRDPDGTITIERLAGNWDWDTKYPLTARTRFWVILYPPAELWEPLGTYADGHRWAGGGGTHGTTATREQVDAVRSIVRDWKAAGSRCVNIILAFDPASFDPSDPPGAPLPDGTWGRYGADVLGVRRPARLATARYWRGTS